MENNVEGFMMIMEVNTYSSSGEAFRAADAMMTI